MTWKIPLSTNTTITLAAGENVYIADDINVFVEEGEAIHAASPSSIVVEGSVITDNDTAIAASNSNDPTSQATVTVTASGRVRSLERDAIGLDGTNTSLDNAGKITAESWAIGLSGDQGGTVTITNSGTILSNDDFGIYSTTTATIIVHNSGTISSEKGVAFQSGDGGVNDSLITNTGRMVGKVQLGFGNDLYDGRKGHVDAPVTGNTGNDRIYGGTENNVLDGGTGHDRILGGRGADILTGGANADRFIFNEVNESTVAASGRDTITDFAHGVDTIDLHAIDASNKVNGDQAFHFIGSQDFHHKAGELHFLRVSGDTVLQGDVNGDGKADFAITLTGHVNVNGGDFAL